MRRLRSGSDDGQVTLLVIAYCTIAVALLFVVASASAVHLERKRLLEVADAAALDAADALASDIYYGRGQTAEGGVPLSDASVRAAVDDYLALRGAGQDFDALSVVGSTGTPDGVTAEVTLTARVVPPLVGALLEPWGGGIQLTVTSRARTELG